MKIDVSEENNIRLKDIQKPVFLETKNNQKMYLSMSDDYFILGIKDSSLVADKDCYVYFKIFDGKIEEIINDNIITHNIKTKFQKIKEKKNKAIFLREKGYSYREIMKILNYKSPRSIQLLINKTVKNI